MLNAQEALDACGHDRKIVDWDITPYQYKDVFLYRNELICIARFNILTFNGAIICIQMTTTTCINIHLVP